MSTLRSKIAYGFTTHTRFSPINRTFKYDLQYLLLNLKESSKLSKCWGFNWGKKYNFSLDDQTYLTHHSSPLIEKAANFIKKHAPKTSYTDIYLLTTPKFFGLNFNPVSFFYFLDDKKNITAIIAEVHNTYNEKHLYLLLNPLEKDDHLFFQTKKELHVSPFYKNEGKYCFLFSKNLGTINVTINYFKGQKKMFNAYLDLKTTKINQFSFFKMGTKFIKTSLLTFTRILFQAAVLKFKFRLPHFKNNGFKSFFSSSRKKTSLLSRICKKKVFEYLNQIENGCITLVLPNGEEHLFGDVKSKKKNKVQINDYKFFSELIFKGDIGFAESYISNYWNTKNLENIFEVFLNNKFLQHQTNPLSQLSKQILRLQHSLRHNSLKLAKKNIYDHYDLGNSFFNLFLDEHKVYSSAIFETPTQSLEDAQINKINHILQLADVKETHKILEIGSGWGALAIHAAKTIGCHVTTVTISEEQYNYVKKRINQEHLDDKIEVKLMDYRLLKGKYDRIVSIEMLEAVGHKYLDVFFKQCNQLLNRNGKAAFQCIMIPKERYERYLKQPDFIQKHIFPGGHLPNLDLIKTVTKSAEFDWLNDYPITSHYVPTLNAWDKQFSKEKKSILKLGFNNKFYKTWRYYFNYCSAGFKTDSIQNQHFLIQKCQ